MPEDDRSLEATVADPRHQTRQRLRGVDRVDEDPLGPSEEPGGVVGWGRGASVTVAELVVDELERLDPRFPEPDPGIESLVVE